jgi:hypothetical protein
MHPSDNAYAVANLHCSALVHKELHNNKNICHVLLVGIGAVRTYFGDAYSKDIAYNKLIGYTFPDTKRNVMVSVVYEPSVDALAKDRKESCVLERTIFRQTLDAAMYRYQEPILDAWKHPEQYCHSVSESKAIEYMDAILDGQYDKFVAIDYETTGLKPNRQGQKAVCVSLCTRNDFSFAFMLTESTNEKLGKILASIHIPIVAANNPFEYKWSKSMGFSVNNLVYDCCLGQHILDHRRGVSSVKFQGHMAFGIYGYEKAMKRYLVPTEEETNAHGANALNRIMGCPQGQLLQYNAMDSLIEYWLAEQAIDKLGIEL